MGVPIYSKKSKIFFILKKANEDESENEIDEDDVKANGGIRKNSIVEQLVAGNGNKRKLPSKKPVITIIVDLAFSTNVRFLDDHELYLDNVELYRVSKTKNRSHFVQNVTRFFVRSSSDKLGIGIIEKIILNFPTLDFLLFTSKNIGNFKKKICRSLLYFYTYTLGVIWTV